MKIPTNRLKEFRSKKNYTQLELARISNICEITYQRYEAGKRIPDVYTAQLLAIALEKELKDVFPLQLALAAENKPFKK